MQNAQDKGSRERHAPMLFGHMLIALHCSGSHLEWHGAFPALNGLNWYLPLYAVYTKQKKNLCCPVPKAFAGICLSQKSSQLESTYEEAKLYTTAACVGLFFERASQPPKIGAHVPPVVLPYQ